MSEQYVPTIGQIRDGYVWLSAGDNPGAREAAGEDFDAAIAAHDREVKAAALREAATALFRENVVAGVGDPVSEFRRLSNRADRIETEADAEFIAHAREDIPALLREIERLQADRDTQGRFLSVVDEFARTTGMSPREVMGVVGVKADADRLAATVERVRRALSNHPHCDIHPGDDPITCGWKRAVLDVQGAIEGTDS